MDSGTKAIFLDRDGILNVDTGYVFKVADLVIPDQVPETLKALQDKGFSLIVITNQSGVARGYFTIEDVNAFHQELQRQMFNRAGVVLDRFYICPHYPGAKLAQYDQDCSCRKPQPGLLLQAANEAKINLGQSWMIGDRDSDILCGQAAGVKTIWQRNLKHPLPDHVKPDYCVETFAEIAAIILTAASIL